MEIAERKIKGVFEVSLKPILDERGFFMRTFDDFLFESNLLFYCISLYSILFVYSIFLQNKNLDNIIILLILFISNPQLSIYHKYYDPSLIFLFFSIFKKKIEFCCVNTLLT